MSVASEVAALRSSAGLSRASHVRLVRVDGRDAMDFLQTVSTQSPYVREGRVRHTLLLREDGGLFADAFLVKADDGFLLLAEGPEERELVQWLEGARDRAPGARQVAIRGMGDDWVALGVDGPYAWEVVSGLLGPVVLGQPYLSLLRRDMVLCLRAGKTGEYGYLLLVPRVAVADIETRLDEIGGPLDLTPVTLEALDVCALESWHFSMRTLRETGLATPLTPIELQLQWRVVYEREFIGAAALRARRSEGARVRVTCFLSDGEVRAGEPIRLGGLDVGEVLAACASPTLGQTVGSALLLKRFAHPHLALSAIGPDREIPLRTCTASLVDNLSLRIQPHKDSYAQRAAAVAPPG